ncbi:MAG: MFS transporter, partial [Planctomycetota bacterium]
METTEAVEPVGGADPSLSQLRDASAASAAARKSSGDGGEERARGGGLYWIVAVSHLVADMYPPFVTALAASLEANLSLSARQVALLFALSPIVSGLTQPIFAHVTDRLDTRVCGPLGVGLCAVFLSSLGYARSFEELVLLQVVGMAGVGMLHPVLAALAGELGAASMQRRAGSARGFALSIFFAMGMAGGVVGPIVATRVNEHLGMRWLALAAAPGLLCAALLMAARKTPHRQQQAGAQQRRRTTLDKMDSVAIAALFVSNALRFTVNIGLWYCFMQWAKTQRADADAASSLAGDVIASAQLGMGLTALAFGLIVRTGREKPALALSGLLTAPAVALMAWAPLGTMHLLAFIAAAGFFGMAPQAIAAAQRLLPASTGLAGAIMMGCGWFISALGPEIAKATIERTGSLAWA